MTDRFGLTITLAGGTSSPWSVSRTDGLGFTLPSPLSQAQADAQALAICDAHAPASYVPPAGPDPDGFALGVQQSATITTAGKIGVFAWIPHLTQAIEAGNPAVVALVWAVEVKPALSSGDAAAVIALASTYSIPGIS